MAGIGIDVPVVVQQVAVKCFAQPFTGLFGGKNSGKDLLYFLFPWQN